MIFSDQYRQGRRTLFGHSPVIVFFAFFLLFSLPAFADNRTRLYRYYIEEGVQAMRDQDRDAAEFYFERAKFLFPDAEAPARYLESLQEQYDTAGRPLQRTGSGQGDLQYRQLIAQGKDALAQGDEDAAYLLFYQAHQMDSADQEPLEFLNLIIRSREGRLQNASAQSRRAQAEEAEIIEQPDPGLSSPRMNVVSQALDQLAGEKSRVAPLSVSAPAAEPVRPPVEVQVRKPASTLPVAAPNALSTTKVGQRKFIEVVSLDDIIQANPSKPTLKLELGAAVVIEGRNIQRFLEIEPGIVSVKKTSLDQLRVDAPMWGSLFLHIWDDRGRTTVYVQVVLPEGKGAGRKAEDALVEHSAPFRLTYSLDNSSFYRGNDVPHLRRQSHDVTQVFGFTGETPYGVADGSITAAGFSPIDDYPTYTLGLSDIPMPWTSDLDLRVFDYNRDLSPLTVSSYLRGVVGEVKLFDNGLALSSSHGRQLASTVYVADRQSSTIDAGADTFQAVLFPVSKEHSYALNYARGYGNDRTEGVSAEVYSVEVQQQINKAMLNAELARNDSADKAAVASLTWNNGPVYQTASFRNINKDYSSVLGTPSGLGETGGIWTTGTDLGGAFASTYLNLYQNNFSPNPYSPHALNYDVSGQISVPVDSRYAFDLSGQYTDLQGEESPRQAWGGGLRVTRFFPFLGGRTGAIFAGGTTQLSRYEYFPQIESDRYTLLTGLQLPFLQNFSGYVNYEYSWVEEVLTKDGYQPSVMTTGLSYSKDFTENFRGTAGISYRNERNVEGDFSYLSGEDSVAGTLALNYTPVKDVNLFMDTRLRNVLAQISDNPSYHDLDVRFGMRMAWGTNIVWDPWGVVAGYVYRDRDGDKVFSKGDEGIEGVVVKVGEKEARTDARGYYRVSVKGRRVAVAPHTPSLPAGAVFVTPAFQKVRTLQAGVRRVDFGLSSQAGIYGTVFVDVNGDGKPDSGDTYLRGVKLRLDDKTVVASDHSGTYFFRGASRGKHIILLDMSSVPIEYVPLIKVKTEIELQEGSTYVFHVPVKPNPASLVED